MDVFFPTKMFIDRAHLAFSPSIVLIWVQDCGKRNATQNNDKDRDNFNIYQPVIFESIKKKETQFVVLLGLYNWFWI